MEENQNKENKKENIATNKSDDSNAKNSKTVTKENTKLTKEQKKAKEAEEMKKKVIIITAISVASIIFLSVILAAANYFSTTFKMGTGACEYLETRDLTGRDIKYVEMCVENYGRCVILLDATTAPITVANFLSLVEEGFYDGLTFHRVILDFMIQGGDPNADGTGGSANQIKGEFSSNGYDNDISHLRGVISMARGGNSNDSASSQFFICNSDSQDSLDGKYAAFGYVVQGMSVIDEITEKVFPKTEYADYYGSYELDEKYGTYEYVVWQYLGNGAIKNKADQPVIKYIKVLESWEEG